MFYGRRFTFHISLSLSLRPRRVSGKKQANKFQLFPKAFSVFQFEDKTCDEWKKRLKWSKTLAINLSDFSTFLRGEVEFDDDVKLFASCELSVSAASFDLQQRIIVLPSQQAENFSQLSSSAHMSRLFPSLWVFQLFFLAHARTRRKSFHAIEPSHSCGFR